MRSRIVLSRHLQTYTTSISCLVAKWHFFTAYAFYACSNFTNAYIVCQNVELIPSYSIKFRYEKNSTR
jgi:hypothetical protein